MIISLALAAALSVSAPVSDRALVAMPAPAGGVYLSWRLLDSDASQAGFDVYRVQNGTAKRVNVQPVTATTDFRDSSGDLAAHDYYVAPTGTSARTPLAQESFSDNIFAFNSTPSVHGRKFATADLDGDGRDDYVLRHATNDMDPQTGKWRRSTGSFTLNAFTRDGLPLWRYSMGTHIEQGTWYSPYVVHDLDGDGRAELIVKTGDANYSLASVSDETGRVTKGPEYLRVIDGRNGRTVLAQTNWPSRAGYAPADAPEVPVEKRKYLDYNHYSRNFIAIGYLDGVTPHVIVNRGTYGKHKVAAYTYSAGKLTKVWSWENTTPSLGGARTLWGQGSHALQARDIDGNGCDEVVIGSLILSSKGQPLFSVGHNHNEHVDHVDIADIDPSNPGLEMYYAAEFSHDRAGAGVIDLDTGKALWSVPWPTTHLHEEGLCADLDARYEGIECYSGEQNKSSFWLMSAKGAVISTQDLGGLSPKALWWDSDRQKELVEKGDGVSTPFYLSNFPELDKRHALPYPKGMIEWDKQYLKVVAVADLIGDWREELVVADRGRILVYSSNIPARSRATWLMQNPGYRLSVTNASSGYYQQPQMDAPVASPPVEACQ